MEATKKLVGPYVNGVVDILSKTVLNHHAKYLIIQRQSYSRLAREPIQRRAKSNKILPNKPSLQPI